MIFACVSQKCNRDDIIKLLQDIINEGINFNVILWKRKINEFGDINDIVIDVLQKNLMNILEQKNNHASKIKIIDWYIRFIQKTNKIQLIYPKLTKNSVKILFYKHFITKIIFTENNDEVTEFINSFNAYTKSLQLRYDEKTCQILMDGNSGAIAGMVQH